MMLGGDYLLGDKAKKLKFSFQIFPIQTSVIALNSIEPNLLIIAKVSKGMISHGDHWQVIKMIKFEKFNEDILHSHFIFPCIDELAKGDQYFKENADYIKKEFIRTQGQYLSWLVQSAADPGCHPDKKENYLNLTVKVFKPLILILILSIRHIQMLYT